MVFVDMPASGLELTLADSTQSKKERVLAEGEAERQLLEAWGSLVAGRGPGERGCALKAACCAL